MKKQGIFEKILDNAYYDVYPSFNTFEDEFIMIYTKRKTFQCTFFTSFGKIENLLRELGRKEQSVFIATVGEGSNGIFDAHYLLEEIEEKMGEKNWWKKQRY